MKASPSVKISTSSNPKSKKNLNREKRKSQSTTEPSANQANLDKSSSTKDGSTRKYAGFGPEHLTIISEQSVNEHLSDDTSTAFTEDINYKLRYVIYNALVRARLCSRNYITPGDIDDTFENLQIEKVYGASSTPNWYMFGDQNLHYLDDSKVNLIEIAEESKTYMQPSEPIITRRFLPESREISQEMKTYFMLMCQAAVDNSRRIRFTALKDISENYRIGPIIEWFYHLGYLLLSKDITYDGLTLFAFDLLEALESNQVSPLIVSDKQIILLARLLLQRLLRSITTNQTLKPLCHMLAIICRRLPVRKMILKKLISKYSEIRDDLVLPVLCAINELGIDAILCVVLPHINNLFYAIETDDECDFVYEFLRTYNIICSTGYNFPKLCDQFYEVFGDSVVPIWKHNNTHISDSLKTDHVSMRIQLLKTRRKLFYSQLKPSRKTSIDEAFPMIEEEDDGIKKEKLDCDLNEDIVEENDSEIKPPITFKFYSFTPSSARSRFLNQSTFQQYKQNCADYVIVGKRTVLVPELKYNYMNDAFKCNNHSIMYHNL